METVGIAKRIAIIDKLKEERQAAKDIIDDALINDDEYRRLEMQVNAQKSDLAAKKAEILTRAENEKIIQKYKEVGQDLKEEREVLAEELIELYRQTQTTEILSADGKKLKLKFSARLIPLESNYQ